MLREHFYMAWTHRVRLNKPPTRLMWSKSFQGQTIFALLNNICSQTYYLGDELFWTHLLLIFFFC